MVFSCSNIKWPFQRIYLVAVWIRNVFYRLMCLKSYFPVTVIKIPWLWEERFLWACDCGSLASLVQSRDTKHVGWGWELRAHISNHKKQREQTRNGSRFENFKSHFPLERPHLWHLPKHHPDWGPSIQILCLWETFHSSCHRCLVRYPTKRECECSVESPSQAQCLAFSLRQACLFTIFELSELDWSDLDWETCSFQAWCTG